MEIQSRFLLTSAYRSSRKVLIYIARDFEIETAGIILAALSNGKTVAVPRCEDGEINFYIIRSLSDLEKGSFEIPEPKKSCEKLTGFEKSICVCPCLCADMRGYRLGFGKGFYDRFLKNYSGERAALCYADALLPEIQSDENDEKVSVLVTDAFVRMI